MTQLQLPRYFPFRNKAAIVLLTLLVPFVACSRQPAENDGLHHDKMLSLETEDQATWYQRSLANRGDSVKIYKVMEKARQGTPITIGAIGGSITAGGVASNYATKAYGPLVRDWWEQKFPGVTINFVNAGIGATNSVFGVHRANRDLLQYHPDLVIVEFSVNDMGEIRAKESYEGLVRKILLSSPGAAVITVATMDNQGQNWQANHLPVAQHYRLPMISYRDAIWPEIVAGNMAWSTLSPDAVHPNDSGHAIIAGLVKSYLDGVYALTAPQVDTLNTLPAPLTTNGYEHSMAYNSATLEPVSYGVWTKDTVSHSWKASSKGAPLTFQVTGGYLSAMFKCTNNGTGGLAYVMLDGTTRIDMDADFVNGWGDYQALKPILYGNDSTQHTLSFYFDDDRPSRSFQLSSILVANY